MIEIRRATVDDCGSIARVHRDTWRDSYAGLLDGVFLADLSVVQLRKHWRQMLDRVETSPDHCVLVAEAEGDVVGFVSTDARSSRPEAWDIEVTMLYVSEPFRGVGVGRSLIESAADYALSRGFFSGGLWVLRDNMAARRFYEARGGNRSGRKVQAVGGRVVPLVGYFWSELGVLSGRGMPEIALESLMRR